MHCITVLFPTPHEKELCVCSHPETLLKWLPVAIAKWRHSDAQFTASEWGPLP